MVNHNGTFVSSNLILTQNRAFLYGDAVFETVKIVNSKILFFEDHYFRLMASMRILRMNIPMEFTLEFLEQELLKVAQTNGHLDSARVRITVYRNDGGYYLPKDRSSSYLISSSELPTTNYQYFSGTYEVELYKDFYVSNQLLSTLKTTQKMVAVLGSIFADENGYDNCLLLNESKNVTEALNGSLFMLMGNKLQTPPLTEGCLNGIMRKQILTIARKMEGIEVVEEPISPFDLQKADELFSTNVIQGIQPITKYRKKEYVTTFSQSLVEQLNKFSEII
jgi:branched-chain amino acid aminotransferase